MAAIEAQASGLYTIMSDSIPKEAGVTSNAIFIGIGKQNEKRWVETILKLKKAVSDRTETCKIAKEEINNSGYNIQREIDKLIKLYE